MKRFHIERHLCCGRSLANGQRLYNYFSENGWVFVKDPRKTDIIVIDTCAVTQKQEDYSVDRVRELSRYKKKIVVCGRLPEISPERLGFAGGHLLRHPDLGELDSIISAEISLEEFGLKNYIRPLYPGEIGIQRQIRIKRLAERGSLPCS